MFYAPRGFILDYNDYDLLKFFTKNIKEYAKRRGAIFIKIDPYISYQERDLEGKIVENGKNNKKAYNNLIKLGYKHFGFNLMQESLQPRWIFITPSKNTTVEEAMKNMDAKTRQILRKNERNKIKVREIDYNELNKFKDIMAHTGERREFIDRPLSYYQEMYKHLHDDGILKILIAELDTNELIAEYQSEIDNLKKEKEDRANKYNQDPSKMNEQKYREKQAHCDKEIERITKTQNHIRDLKLKYGNIITLGGILFLIYGNEVLSLVGGSYKEFMEFQSAYTVHFAGLKYAIENNYDRYNFYGITGVFDPENPLFGLYSFKRDFGGKVVELIGEFDLVIDKPMYSLYKIAFKTYKKLKNIKNHIKS
jgi:lipid II:glycine glycyltransferase (peptidoglycan interpeptide bridge formation enzyme)